MYEQNLDSNELMHYGVPGMKWGVRKETRQIRHLQRSTIKKMRKINRLKNAMRMQLHYRKDTLKLIDAENRARGRGQIFKANVYKAIMNTTNPLRTLANKRVNHLNKQIADNMTKVSQLSLNVSGVYINKGQDYLSKLEAEMDRRKGITVR